MTRHSGHRFEASWLTVSKTLWLLEKCYSYNIFLLVTVYINITYFYFSYLTSYVGLHTRTREGERVGSVEVPLRTTRSSKGPEDIISFKEMLSQTVAIASNPVKMEGVQSGNPCSAILHNNKMGSSNASRIPTDPSTLSSKRNMVSASNDEVLQTRKRRRAQCRDSASEAEPGSWKIAQEVCERVADDKPHNFAQSDSDNYQSSNEESWNEAVLDSCDTNADVDSRKHR